MLSKIILLVSPSLYDAKSYFTKKLADALQRQGIQTEILNFNTPNFLTRLKEVSQSNIADLTCSYNSWGPYINENYFWKHSQIPHWSILLEPCYFSSSLFQTQNSIVSSVDKADCEYIRSLNFKNAFFWPHAADRELFTPAETSRPYEVVFLGSCFDHESLRDFWKAKYPPKICEVIENAVEILLSSPQASIINSLHQALSAHQLELNEKEREELLYYVDYYARGKDRLELIRAIKYAEIHVIGGTCWHKSSIPLSRGWSQILSGLPNVKIHPAISFEEALEILKRCKICLNSVPFFKNGTHERIFNGLICGSLPITTQGRWVQENFNTDELLVYQPKHWQEVNEMVQEYLNDENKRATIVTKGQARIFGEHHWDKRVEQLKEYLPAILSKIDLLRKVSE